MSVRRPAASDPESQPRLSAPPSSLLADDHREPLSVAPGRPRGAFTQHRRMDDLRQLLHQHPSGLTINEMAERLQVSSRSLHRYLKEMRRDTELEAVTSRPGGAQRWRVAAADVPRRVAVRRTQAYAVLAARSLFEPLRGSTLFEEIELLSHNLLGIARRPGRGPNAGMNSPRLEDRFVHVPFAPKDYRAHAETVDDVFQAVANLHHLSCGYPRAHDGVYELLELQPFALVLYKDSLYCIARKVGDAGSAGTPRTPAASSFALERMVDTHAHPDRTFELPEGFEVEHHVQGQFGIWSDDHEPVTVVIDFDPAVAEYVANRRVHPSQQLEPTGGGGVRMRLQLGKLDEVATWVLGFGSNARVVEPDALRAHVRDELRRALTRYDDADRNGPEPAPRAGLRGDPPHPGPDTQGELPFRRPSGLDVLLG